MDKKLVYEILEELIKIDTSNPPGNEKRAAQYLADLFERNQIQTEIQDLGNNRANVVAHYGNGEPEMIFCGHLDVVPAIEKWTYPPFELTKKGGRLYGRGTSDMKGGVAAMSAVLIELARKKMEINGKLTLVFVADEESSNLGMRYFLKEKRKTKFAVIGEPTELRVAVAHRGVLRDYIDIIDHSYHAALLTEHHNAMQNSAKAIISIFQLNERLTKYKHKILPSPSIAVTMAEGYESDNIVPGRVRLMTDFRILPGMSFDECRRLEQSALTEVGEYKIFGHFFLPGGEIDSEDDFVKRCCQIGNESERNQMEPIAFQATCEQCLMEEQGIPTIICGPGSLQQAHTVDEFIEEEQIYRAEEFYFRMVQEFLMGENRV